MEILRNQALAGPTNSNSVAATFAKSRAPSVTNVFQLCPGFIKASMVIISPQTVSNSSTYRPGATERDGRIFIGDAVTPHFPDVTTREVDCGPPTIGSRTI